MLLYYIFSGGSGSMFGSSRLRFDQHFTSEMEGDKMVLKITKPPRNKDSLGSLTGQSFSWLMNVRTQKSSIFCAHIYGFLRCSYF